MWIHWNVRGSRPALAFAHLPTTTTASPWSPARPLGPRDPSGRRPSQPEQARAGEPSGTKIALAKASPMTRFWPRPRPCLPSGKRVALCPPQLCVPAWGLPPASAAHLCPLSGTGREVKRELPRLAGKQHRNCRHSQGLTLPTGKQGGVQGVSGCPGSKITLELSTCQGPVHVSPGICCREAEGISKAITVILGSWICSGERFGIFLVGEYCKFYDW